MNKIILILLIGLIGIGAAVGCSGNFLDIKPSSEILLPNRLEDLRGLLDNSHLLTKTPGLPQLSADEYCIVDDQAYNGLADPIARNAYIWQQDLYEGRESIADWNTLYAQILYANSTLEVLEGRQFENDTEVQFLTGWALFIRAHALYQLVANFAPAYDAETADRDLGVPVRLASAADQILKRSSVRQTYQQIFSDLEQALPLLPDRISAGHLNRPSKPAVWALRARIYLMMREYGLAEMEADSLLGAYPNLVDYNEISIMDATPFQTRLDEVIYSTTQVTQYSTTTAYNSRLAISIDRELIAAYESNDLRLKVFFLQNNLGNYNVKRGYVNDGVYAFTGLATDEIYLIKAECLARRNEIHEATQILNSLLVKRYDDSVPYIPFEANSQQEAVEMILKERRKELVWRGIRWHDLKRLSKEGHGHVLSRKVNGEVHTLPPNDLRYVFPIPDDEIALSGIQQNQR